VRAFALLLLFQTTLLKPPPPAPRVVELSRVSTGVLTERVLDLAFVDGSSLLVLAPEALSLYHLEGSDLRLVDRKPLTGPLRPVRAPAGMLLLADGEAFCWALTSVTPRATLFAVTRRGLDVQSEADAIPWPGVDGGVRFRAGTNLVSAAIPGIEGPSLRLLAADEPWVVGAQGELWTNGRTSALRVGPALAALWPGLVAAASANAPGSTDDVLVITPSETQAEIVSRFAVPGAVRALAARADGRKRLLAAALETPDNVFRIVLLELAEAER
jgi:hypothetical protein